MNAEWFWRQLLFKKPGPVFVVEGASDALALTAAGLAALGRFSNIGGGDQLAEVLKDLPADRPIVVLAENDEREKDGKLIWPGKVGAEKVAEVLRSKLNRPVRIVYPPAEFKDARDWVQDMAAGAIEGDSWAPVGGAILRHVEKVAAAQSRFKFTDSAEFLAGDYRLEYLVPRVLVKGQPAVIGGPSKTLKTSVMIDLGISMATATPFLGKFPVHRRSRVAIVSGESGEFTLEETCLRILRAKGIEPASLSGWLKWEFRLPVFTDATVMLDFAERLCALEAEVVMIDPTYLALGEVDAKSVFEMGRVLRPVAEVLLSRGITPLLAHHSNRMLPVGEVMGLEHLSHAGFAEFSRQWLLLNRREKYAGDGNHALWLAVGGSAGHGGIWALDVEEGVLDEGFTTRRWDVALRDLNEVATTAAESREEAKREKALQKTAHEHAAVLLAIDAECAKLPAATKTAIKERTGYDAKKASEIYDALMEKDTIEVHEFQKPTCNGATLKVVGYRRVKVAPGTPGETSSGCHPGDVPQVGEEHPEQHPDGGGPKGAPPGDPGVRPPASLHPPDDEKKKAIPPDVPGRKPKRKRKPAKQTS